MVFNSQHCYYTVERVGATVRWRKKSFSSIRRISCRRGAEKPTPDAIDLSVPPEFDLPGAKLLTLTKATAYTSIRRIKESGQRGRRQTLRQLDKVCFALRDATGALPVYRSVWLSLTKKDFSQSTRQFLYRCLHDAFRVGDHWVGIPGYEECVHCPCCPGSVESLDHILVYCQHPTTQSLWQLARALWPPLLPPLSAVTPRLLLGVAASAFPIPEHATKEQRRQLSGASRLGRIILAETAHLVWKIRCLRVIQDIETGPDAAATRWRAALQTRLTTDRIAATHLSRRPSFVALVHSTWSPIVGPDVAHHPNWVTALGVLVSIRPTRAPRC